MPSKNHTKEIDDVTKNCNEIMRFRVPNHITYLPSYIIIRH